MPGEIPDARFRLPTTFAAKPDLALDIGPGRDHLMGQNAPRGTCDAIYLGKHAETPHRGVWMDIRGAHVLYVMGKRRSGKSYTLGALAEGLVASSWIRQGDALPAVLILDTMNVYLTMPFGVEDTHKSSSTDVQALRKWKLEGEALPLRMFAPTSTAMPSEIASSNLTLRASDLEPEEWCGLFEVDPFVDPMGHLMTALCARVSAEGVVDRETGAHEAPTALFGLPQLLHALERDHDLAAYHDDTRAALRRRLEAVSRSSVFGDDGIDMHELLRPGEITVLLLRDLDVEMRSVIVSIIVKRMMRLRAISEQQERMIPIHTARADKYRNDDPARAEKEETLAEQCRERAREDGLARSWLIIDEAHNYAPAHANVPSRRPLKKYVDEGRNLGLSIVVATQQPSGLDPSLQRNADLLLIHALSHHDDIVAAQGMINTAVPEEIVLDGKHKISGARTFESLIRSLPMGYAVASTDRANRLFPLCVRPRTTVHGGADY